MLVEQKANEIANQMVNDGEDKNFCFDPATLLLLIYVIIAIVRLWRECSDSPADLVNELQKPGLMARWQLRKIIRHELNDDYKNARYAHKIANATLVVGSSLTEDDVTSLYIEVPPLAGEV